MTFWDGSAAVAEYFDIGHSRLEVRLDRPQSAALLAAVADPHRGTCAEGKAARYGTVPAATIHRVGWPVTAEMASKSRS